VGIAIDRVNQVWCSDVTYIPMAKGFLYLVVIMDWVSRAVLAWRWSNTLGAECCVEAFEERSHSMADPRSSIPIRACPSEGWVGGISAPYPRHSFAVDFTPSYRDVENLLAERRLKVSSAAGFSNRNSQRNHPVASPRNE
jgi:hypothetical protein